MLFDADGELLASLRECPRDLSRVTEELRPLVERPRAYAARGVAYLPVLSRCRLVIVGGGHVGKAVGQMAADLDFDVWIIDDRAEYVSEERFPQAVRRISGPIEQVLPDLEITSDTYCLIIVTRGHNHDQEALFHLAASRGAVCGSHWQQAEDQDDFGESYGGGSVARGVGSRVCPARNRYWFARRCRRLP